MKKGFKVGDLVVFKKRYEEFGVHNGYPKQMEILKCDDQCVCVKVNGPWPWINVYRLVLAKGPW